MLVRVAQNALSDIRGTAFKSQNQEFALGVNGERFLRVPRMGFGAKGTTPLDDVDGRPFVSGRDKMVPALQLVQHKHLRYLRYLDKDHHKVKVLV